MNLRSPWEVLGRISYTVLIIRDDIILSGTLIHGLFLCEISWVVIPQPHVG